MCPSWDAPLCNKKGPPKNLVVCGWGNKVVSRGTPLVFCNDYLGSRLNKEGRKEIWGLMVYKIRGRDGHVNMRDSSGHRERRGRREFA